MRLSCELTILLTNVPVETVGRQKTECLLAVKQLTGINKCSDFSEWTHIIKN